MKLFERNLKIVENKKKFNKISISFELLLFAWILPTQNVGVNNAVIEIEMKYFEKLVQFRDCLNIE